MWFVEEQRKTRLPWKYSQSHLLRGFSIKIQNFLQVQQQSNDIDLWGLCRCFCCWRLFWIATKWKLLWRYWNEQPPVNVSVTAWIIPFSKDFKEGSTLQTLSIIHWYFLCMSTKLFYVRYERCVGNLMARCSICCEWYH